MYLRKTLQLARIPVQKPFCENCIPMIAASIKQVDAIEQVYLDPLTAMVTFYFITANQVSEVLNLLIALGYPPQGDPMNQDHKTDPICNCSICIFDNRF